MKTFLFLPLLFFSVLLLGQPLRDSRRDLREIDFSTFDFKTVSRSVNLNPETGEPLDVKQDLEFELAPGVLDFDHSTPFISFSIAWTEAAPELENTHVFVAFSTDGVQWEDWEKMESDPHAVDIRHSFASGLVYRKPEFKHYRLRIRTNRMKAGNTVQNLLLNFFSPGAPVASSIRSVEREKVDVSAACACPQPAFVSRKEWNCPQGQTAPGFTTVTHLIVHHSAGTNISNDWSAIVLAIWNLHVYTNGWADLGYNWLIDPNGKLYEGRGGGDNVTGAHFCGKNSGTMGTCMLGTYTTSQITAAAKSKLVETLAWKACQRNIAPLEVSYHNSTQSFIFNISGHRDGCSTECPGQQVYQILPELRAAVQAQTQVCESATPVLSIQGLTAMNLTPNPASSMREVRVQFSLASAHRMSYRILNVQGGVVHESEVNHFPAGASSFYLSGVQAVAPGTYYFQLRTATEYSTYPFTIQ